MTSSKYQKQKFSKKYFTIEGAESLLPKIEIILKRTIKVDKALDLLSSIEIEVYDDDYNNLTNNSCTWARSSGMKVLILIAASSLMIACPWPDLVN